jgi:hypothetical protein
MHLEGATLFKDDALIAILSAVVLMVAVGTVIQRSEGAAGLWSDDEQSAEQTSELQVLVEDHAVIPVNEVSTLDVLANDIGLTAEMSAGLQVLDAPVCALMSVGDGVIQFFPQLGCEGSHTLSYTVPGLQAGTATTVFVIVEPQESSEIAQAGAVEQTSPRVVVETPSVPQVAYSATDEKADSQDQGLPLGDEGDQETLGLLERDPQSQEQPAPSQPVSTGVVETVVAQEKAYGSPATEQQETQPNSVPVRRAEPEPTVAEAPDIDPLLVREKINLEPAVPEGLLALSDALSASLQPSGDATLPRRAPPQARDVVFQDDGGFLVAVIEAREPETGAPIELRAKPFGEEGLLLGATSDAGDFNVAALAPESSSAGPSGLGQALGSLPQDLDQPGPAVNTVPKTDSADTETARLSPADGVAPAAAPAPSTSATLPAEPRSTPVANTQPCEEPPAMTIDVRRAGQTIVSVLASCQADTIAELQYSGLKLAMPLDPEGRGSLLTLGFEANAPALLTFSNGEKIDFDLPFKGVNRVSRVAVVWDTPIALELNALEFGAVAGTKGHVSPENPRNFEMVRPTGGGYLSSYRAEYGVGQNVEVYSHWSHRAGQTGVVKMMIDFASRNRDRLEGTCGDGRYATPQFLIIRSVQGRLERPILRKLAALDCSSVTQESGDKRLIYGAVNDLLITRK